MNIFYKAFSRAYQRTMKVGIRVMNFREPVILDGISGLANKVKELNFDTVLIVTDDALHNKLLLLEDLKAKLAENGVFYAVYDKTVPNPTIDNIEEGLKLYKESNCKAIIAFGGGSPMDCAKGIAARLTRPKKTVSDLRGLFKIHKKTPTLFAVPTTSGTGSEATVAAIITDPTTHEKYALSDPSLIPAYAVLDPNLTLKLPPQITSTTGMDALTHAVEAYIGKGGMKKTNKYALEATTIIFTYLKTAYDDGTNIEARKQMQLASYYAGVAFTRAYVGYVHSIAHALGGMYGVPHGLANAVILPYILDFSIKKSYGKLARLADAAKIDGANKKEKAERFVQAVRDMNAYMQIPSHIDKIKDEDIPLIAARACKEANPQYPVPRIMTKKQMREIIKTIKG